ncbi:MAG: hypothetical protein ABI797_03055 [Chloroflexota bacterium]
MALMSRVRLLGAAACLSVLAACTAAPPAPSPTPVLATPSAVSTSGVVGQALLPNPAAEHTLGDIVRLSGGEFVGDQADLTVLEGHLLPPAGSDAPRYAFLVEITGLDPDTFPYNLRDFRLIDEQSFQYEPLYEGGQTPRLEFGDLAPSQLVRGWLTFEGPTASAIVTLQYSPALALEPALVSVVVP